VSKTDEMMPEGLDPFAEAAWRRERGIKNARQIAREQAVKARGKAGGGCAGKRHAKRKTVPKKSTLVCSTLSSPLNPTPDGEVEDQDPPVMAKTAPYMIVPLSYLSAIPCPATRLLIVLGHHARVRKVRRLKVRRKHWEAAGILSGTNRHDRSRVLGKLEQHGALRVKRLPGQSPIVEFRFEKVWMLRSWPTLAGESTDAEGGMS
jgi:hypothetical protein